MARTKLVTVEVVRNGQILGYILRGSCLDLLIELDGEQGEEKWGEGNDHCKVWHEVGKYIGEAGLVKKELDFGYERVRLQIYGRHPSGNSRQAVQY